MPNLGLKSVVPMFVVWYSRTVFKIFEHLDPVSPWDIQPHLRWIEYGHFNNPDSGRNIFEHPVFYLLQHHSIYSLR